MRKKEKEYPVDVLVENPAAGLAMKSAGMDCRSIGLLLDMMARQTCRGQALPSAPFVS
jgi:hypothetical protein